MMTNQIDNAYLVAIFILIVLALVSWFALGKLHGQQFQVLTLEELHSRTPKDFELFCKNLFQHMGFSVIHVGRSGDGGVDLRCQSKKEGLTLVQCKRWLNTKVSPAKVRELVGAAHNADARTAYLVTTGKFTKQAEREAEQTRKPPTMKTINGAELLYLEYEISKRAQHSWALLLLKSIWNCFWFVIRRIVRLAQTRWQRQPSRSHEPLEQQEPMRRYSSRMGEAAVRTFKAPRTLDKFIGHREVVENLGVAIGAALRRGEPLDHVLLHGPEGVGKKTLAQVIANEMGSQITHTSGPALEKPGDIVGLLSNLERGDVIFFDEIHCLSHTVEEYLYSGMEDFSLDLVTGQGPKARSLRYRLEHFTLIGATTGLGLLSTRLRGSFGIIHHLDPYRDEDVVELVIRAAEPLGITIGANEAMELARHSNSNLNTASGLLRRARDYAQVGGVKHITAELLDVVFQHAATIESL